MKDDKIQILIRIEVLVGKLNFHICLIVSSSLNILMIYDQGDESEGEKIKVGFLV